MTTANIITVCRILLVPFFVVQVLYFIDNGNGWHRIAALISFAVAAISDGVDGYIARRYNQTSELGAILDPLADKLLLVSAIILLSLNNTPHFSRIPLWIAGVILGRDVILVIGMALIHQTFGTIKIRPKFLGKASTVLQMGTVLWILLQWNETAFILISSLTAIFTAISGLLYILDGLRHLSTSPVSAPSKLD